MEKKDTSSPKPLPEFVASEDFPIRLRATVQKQRSACRKRNWQVSEWLKSFADASSSLATELAKLGADTRVVSGLRRPRVFLADLASSKSTDLHEPLLAARKCILADPKLFSPAVDQIFAQFRKLLYPDKSETRRDGDSNKDTVQEFNRVPPLTKEEFEDISAPLEWARSLDEKELIEFLGLSPQQLLRYLTKCGFSVRQLARDLDVSHVGLSHIMRGKRGPSEALTTKIRLKALFPEK